MRALICGISGQDGAYLAELLLGKGYEVFGTSRDINVRAFSGLELLGVLDRVQLLSMSVTDFRSVPGMEGAACNARGCPNDGGCRTQPFLTARPLTPFTSNRSRFRELLNLRNTA